MSINDRPRLKSYSLTVTDTSEWNGANRLVLPGIGIFFQFINASAYNCYVRLDDDSESEFLLATDTAITFSHGDISAAVVDFNCITSGTGGSAVIELMVGVING